jgi:glucan phosphoethanolaminetransferase (alkaline phosphatase superfamily)
VPIYLVGFVLAMVLLGIALARSGSVPTWAGVLLPISVVVGVIGSGAGVTLVIVLGDLMLLAVFATCAKAMFASAVSSHEAFEPVRA